MAAWSAAHGAASALTARMEETGQKTPGCAERPQFLSLQNGNVVNTAVVREAPGGFKEKKRAALAAHSGDAESEGASFSITVWGARAEGARENTPAIRSPGPRAAALKVSNEACSYLSEAKPRIFTEQLKSKKKFKNRNHP